MIELAVQSSKKGQGRESLQSPLVIHTVLAIVVIYVITHTDYTNIYTHVIAIRLTPHDACSICLVDN